MELKVDEFVHGHPKRRKPENQDSMYLPMPNLPAELVNDILLKLPVKSLMKFRSVSKSWTSLISSPDFVKTHLLLSASDKDFTNHRVMFKVTGIKDCSLNSLLYSSVTEAFDLDYPGINSFGYPLIVGSVNGLVCLAIGLLDGLYDLYLWNPSIRMYKKLPDFGLDVSAHYHANESVDFKFGFAYDELQDDYKVVGLFPIYSRGRLSHVEVKIYSLRSDSWRRISDFQGRNFFHISGKFVNGRIYWIQTDYNIISIDMDSEKWTYIEKPSNVEGYSHLVLGVLGNDLSMLCNYTWCDPDVWVMKGDGVKESWMKMFTIRSPNNFMAQICHPPILVSNEGDILIQIGSRLWKYNPKDDSIRYLYVTNFGSYIEAEIYVESLVCPFSQRDLVCNNNGGSNNSDEVNRATTSQDSTSTSRAQVQPLSLGV